jgi:hypothetical protein
LPDNPTGLSRDPKTSLIDVEIIKARIEARKVNVVTVFHGLTVVGVYGLALGATGLVLSHPDASVHAAALLVIWISTSIFNVIFVMTGVLAIQQINLGRVQAAKAAPVPTSEIKKPAIFNQE